MFLGPPKSGIMMNPIFKTFVVILFLAGAGMPGCLSSETATITSFEKCDDKERAHKLLRAAIKRFPQDRALKLRARKLNLEGLDELLKSLKTP